MCLLVHNDLRRVCGDYDVGESGKNDRRASPEALRAADNETRYTPIPTLLLHQNVIRS